MKIYVENLMSFEDFKILPITERIKIAEEVELKYPFELSEDAKQIIQNLLQKNPEKRLRERKIKKHKFFDDVQWPIMPKT
ncbi:serine/threonine-protein kinase gad8-like [Centruroides sculpturatus]|uniref:serine/threonine-protein kinase gad8-like n=1 Tax=Centruroides sculpturatus TaxID=218467 RepID=UPI000C6D9CFD|nr:serine/threonine-protein kinase gad8-like [Centruroides sculpturatus]